MKLLLHIESSSSVLSKYSGVLSDIGLTDFEILSDRTKFCQTELFFHKAYNFGHIMIVGLNICMFFVQRQMDKVIFNVIYCSSVACHIVVPAKAKHDRGMDGRTDDGRNDPYFRL